MRSREEFKELFLAQYQFADNYISLKRYGYPSLLFTYQILLSDYGLISSRPEPFMGELTFLPVKLLLERWHRHGYDGMRALHNPISTNLI